jgi:hypothetical protein
MQGFSSRDARQDDPEREIQKEIRIWTAFYMFFLCLLKLDMFRSIEKLRKQKNGFFSYTADLQTTKIL